MEYQIGNIIRMSEEKGHYDWTIREKKNHEGQYLYFMTRTGFEGWFTSTFISEHTTK